MDSMTGEGVAALLGIVFVISTWLFVLLKAIVPLVFPFRSNAGHDNHQPRTMDESLADHGDFRAYIKKGS